MRIVGFCKSKRTWRKHIKIVKHELFEHRKNRYYDRHYSGPDDCYFTLCDFDCQRIKTGLPIDCILIVAIYNPNARGTCSEENYKDSPVRYYFPYIRVLVIWKKHPELSYPEHLENKIDCGLFDLHGKYKYEGTKVSPELEEQVRNFLKKYKVLLAATWGDGPIGMPDTIFEYLRGEFSFLKMIEIEENGGEELFACFGFPIYREKTAFIISEYKLAKQEGRYSDLPDDEQDLKILEDIVRQNNLYDLYDESPKGLGRLVETDKLNFSFDFSIKGGVGRTFRAKVSWDRERPVGKSQTYFELYGDYKYIGKKVKPELEEEARAFFRKYQVLLAAVWAGVLEKDSLYDYFYDSLPFAELLSKFKLSAQELAKVNQMLNHAKKHGLYSNLPEDVQNLKILANIVRERRLYYLPK